MRSKNLFMLIVLLVCGVLVGALIASATKNLTYMSWLSYAINFGIDTGKPAMINLSVLKLAFGLEINISVAQIICLAVAALLYKRLR